jgi:hypothetical protein
MVSSITQMPQPRPASCHCNRGDLSKTDYVHRCLLMLVMRTLSLCACCPGVLNTEAPFDGVGTSCNSVIQQITAVDRSICCSQVGHGSNESSVRLHPQTNYTRATVVVISRLAHEQCQINIFYMCRAAATEMFDTLPNEVVRVILTQVTEPMRLDSEADNLTQWCQLASVCRT